MAEGRTREYTLAILKNMELRYSAASKFNDPFDCHLDVAMRSTEEVEEMFDRAIDHAGDAMRGFFRKLRQGMRERMEKDGKTVPSWLIEAPKQPTVPRKRSKWTVTIEDSAGQPLDLGQMYNRTQESRMQEFYRLLDVSFGVLCLSERPDDILLWSHYGNCHSGLCLEFDAAGYPDTFPRLRPVTYQEEYPIIPAVFPDILEIFRDRKDDGMKELLLNVADLLIGGLADASAETPATPDALAAFSIARWFYVKSSFWSYEREWRCLKWRPGPQRFSPHALRRIIVGCVDTDTNLALVRDVLKGTALVATPIFKAVRKRREFGLDLVAVE